MNKTKIEVSIIGHMPPEFEPRKIELWQSEVFELTDSIKSYTLNIDSDGRGWSYTDKALEMIVPKPSGADFLVAIVNIPIEMNWYTRRLSENRVVFTFFEIREILLSANIPLENVIYRLLYAYTLVFIRCGNQVPTSTDITNFTHDETRGCIFDMNGVKSGIIHSCHSPIICPDCVDRLNKAQVPREVISICQVEIKKVKKTLFYQISDFIKKHPIWSLVISGITAVLLSAVGSILGTAVCSN